MGRWNVAGQVLDLLVSFEGEKEKRFEVKISKGKMAE
jgi:hypothetical protein